ncbi:MAG: DEAD/DEAH box helicase family protein [Caldilineaceae bacterium]
MPLNEADTRAQLVDPQLNKSEWTRSQVTREQYYRTDWSYTAGRVILRGDKAERASSKRVDYLLRFTDSFPIAVVEAKEESLPAVSGLDQVKRYARDLGLAFAYSTNGHEILEWDFFTNLSRTINLFPTPAELWQRWSLNTGLTTEARSTNELRPIYRVDVAQARRRNPLLHPYAPILATRGKEPRYFQEAAVREAILRMMRGQKRILLTLATGTGKTFIAFQIAWKLIRSGWLRHQGEERPGRILFLADRVVLRDQAYNAFSPFADASSDPRFNLDGERRLSLNFNLYFAIYHNLWSVENRKRVFEKFPPNFFDLIIIDEAHRSGFGTWKEILNHFTSAIHLGMTATPKQDENIDTYAYFCQEEPEKPVDTEDPSKGAYKPPAYHYSLGQGIDDGFLATYKIHRIRTNIDKKGLHIQEELERGAELFIPEGAKVRDDYGTPEFERAIRLPDRTQTLVQHLTKLLRRFGPLQKTMVFCVDMSHAQEVARLLNNEFAELGFGDDYAVAIVSEEGEQGRRRLRQFQDSDHQLPVIATTAELLSTGVDVPSTRNIVFMKTLASPILFKQIIGRGTRIDPDSDKLWFRIIDYTNATRLLDPKWDRPPSVPSPVLDESQMQSLLRGTVRLAESGDRLVGATIAVIAGPNDQRGPILSDEDGNYFFDKLPPGTLIVIASGPGLARRELKVEVEINSETIFDIELKPANENQAGKITMKGLDVIIEEEATFVVSGVDEPMTLDRYIDYTRSKVVAFVPDWNKLSVIWQDVEKRRVFLEQLEAASIHVDVLVQILEQNDVDQFDLLANLAYGRPLQTRRARATAFRNREESWLSTQTAEAREVVLALIDKYEHGGLKEMTDPTIFRVSPFREMGEVRGVLRRFGGDASRLTATIVELQRRLYAV